MGQPLINELTGRVDRPDLENHPPHKSALAAVAASLCAIVVTVLMLTVPEYYLTAKAADVELWVACLWIVAPYLGHCALALAFRRDHSASALVFGGTLLSACCAVTLVAKFIIYEVREFSSDHKTMEDFAPLFIFIVLIFLQWAFVAGLGITALVIRSKRDDKKTVISEL